MAVLALIVSSFFRMRSYRKDKASLTLKLCLPFFRAETEEEKEKCESLNSFYFSLADAYRDSLIKLACETEGISVVSVNFTVVNDKYKNRYKRLFSSGKNLLAIERYVGSKGALLLPDTRIKDVVDLDGGFLLK